MSMQHKFNSCTLLRARYFPTNVSPSSAASYKHSYIFLLILKPRQLFLWLLLASYYYAFAARCVPKLCVELFFAQFKISSLERKSQKKEGCTALSKSTEEQSLKKVKSARIYKCTRALANTELLDVPFVKPSFQPKCLIRLDLVIGLVNSRSRNIHAWKQF